MLWRCATANEHSKVHSNAAWCLNFAHVHQDDQSYEPQLLLVAQASRMKKTGSSSVLAVDALMAEQAMKEQALVFYIQGVTDNYNDGSNEQSASNKFEDAM